jgi:hypothetical protein
LVIVGLAFALVGGGLVGALYILQEGSNNAVSTSISFSLASGSSDNVTLQLAPTSSGTFALSWSSTAHASVTVWRAEPCSPGTGICTVGPALIQWPSNESGRWSISGTIGSYYLLTAGDVDNRGLNFTGTTTEQFLSTNTALSLPIESLIIAAAGVLLTAGGIAVFLGLFLRAGVYSDPNGPPPRRVGGALSEFDEDEEFLDPSQK